MMTASWSHEASNKAIAVKSSHGVASYLSHDCKPVVCLRARLRLGVALTPLRRFIYRQVLSPMCPRCGVVGSTEHVVLHCAHFGVVRARCMDSLSALFFPVQLTM